jgi:glycosyltransferase involved in cell wall biosynthesis
VFIFPSKNETFGIVPLEAMACSLPVVCSDIPALRESTGGNAILVPPEDLDSWVNAVTKVLSDEELRKELSKKGIEWAKRFTWEKKAEEYAKGLLKAREMFIESRKRH